jgi:hypothetical protein
MHVVTFLNVVYGLIELSSYRINPTAMLTPTAKTVTTIINGIFNTTYLFNIGYRMGCAARDGGWKQTWDKKTKVEKVCLGMAGCTVVTGWGAWLGGVCNKSNKGWMALLMVGYLLGTTGHTFQMISSFVKSRREIKT